MLFLNDTQVFPQALFTIRSIGDRMVIKLMCPSVRERQSSVLMEQLRETVTKAKGRIVLELSEVQSCTCAGINAMMELSKLCRAEGGELLLVRVPESLRKLLILTGLTRQLTIVSQPSKVREVLGQAAVEPWKLAVARLLDLPLAESQYSRAA